MYRRYSVLVNWFIFQSFFFISSHSAKSTGVKRLTASSSLLGKRFNTGTFPYGQASTWQEKKARDAGLPTDRDRNPEFYTKKINPQSL